MRLVIGSVILLCTLPFVGVVVGSSVLWKTIMEKTLACYTNTYWMSSALKNFNSRFVKHPEDSFMMNLIYMFGIVMPGFFFFSLWYTKTYGFSFALAFVYNLIRIGPYFMNFAYIYTSCHKEGHSPVGLFKPRYNFLLRNIFNWWIGIFFGVMPSSFAYGHSKNHHKYDNLEDDIISSADLPRDSFPNFLAYIPRFFLYALNISSVMQFFAEGQYKYCIRMMIGNVVFGAFFYLSYEASPVFALAFVLYPFLEQCILLAVVAWTWHAFIDPNDIFNEYACSITIFDGEINVLQENFHVVHHMYPAVHWTEHEALYEKHKDEYATKQATMFRKTHVFELFFLMILHDYKQLTDKFVDFSGKLSYEEKMKLIKDRLRVCTWGPLCPPSVLEQTKSKRSFYQKWQGGRGTSE